MTVISHAIQLSLTAFIAWAIGRELDPDFTFTSYLAVPLAIAAAVWWESPSILALAGTMMAVRVVNRTVGPRFSDLDSLTLIGGAGVMGLIGHPIVGVGMVIGIGLNHFLPNHDRPRAVQVAGLALVAVVIGTVIALPLESKWELDARLMLALLMILILYFYGVYRTPNPPTSVTDIKKQPLSHQRIIAAQVLAVMIAIVTGFVFGDEGVQSLSALWAAFLAMGLRPIYQRAVSR